MTADGFRRLALSFPEAAEGAHMKHPDFRVRGKIFATLGYPDRTRGMIKLTREQQDEFVGIEPATFSPVNGQWGQQGATSVQLGAAKKNVLRRALAAAWCNAAPREMAKQFEAKFD